MTRQADAIKLPGVEDMEAPIVRISADDFKAAGLSLVEAGHRLGVEGDVMLDVLAACGITRESTTRCQSQLGRLRCNQEAGHEFGCTYESETGSAVDDHHADGGHG